MLRVYQFANQGLLDGCTQTTMPTMDAGHAEEAGDVSC
jgi:hypothetical protein